MVGKNLDVFKYAHENGCKWSELTCTTVARLGLLDFLKYAYGNGYRWDESLCKAAAKYGYLDILKYTHENNCPCFIKHMYGGYKKSPLKYFKICI